MITVKVGGKPLYIPKDTALVMEQNNYVMSDEDIAADIVWTFEVPAEPNAEVLGFGHLMHAAGRQRYDCELYVNGIVFSKGQLYVQSCADEKNLTCGIVANAFGVGFGKQRMNENDYGDNITIASSEDGHQQGWIDFFKSTLGESSTIKFPLFIDEKFYQDNEDFGYHLNQVSGLNESTLETQMYKYINRLFFSQDGETVYNNGDSVSQGVRLFNSTTNSGKQNGYAFAPALRLDWLVRQVLRNAGLNVGGSFFTEGRIKRLFCQSLNAMDGDVFQYGTKTWLRVGGNVNTYPLTISDCQSFEKDGASGSYTSFAWRSGVSMSFRMLLPVEELVHSSAGESMVVTKGGGSYSFWANRTDEIYALAILPSGGTLPNIRMRQDATEADGTRSFKYGLFPSYDDLKNRGNFSGNQNYIKGIEITGSGRCRVSYRGTGGVPMSTHSFRFYNESGTMLIQLSKSVAKNVFFSGALGGYTEGTVMPVWHPSWGSTQPLYIRLVKCKVGSARGELDLWNETTWGHDSDGKLSIAQYGDLEVIGNYEVQASMTMDSTDEPLNIFSNILKWKEHVPDLSNGEFLGIICKTFGLSMYANPLTHEAQLSFFVDVNKGKAFDISEWVTRRERMEYTPKRYEVTLKSCLGGNDVAEKNVLETVDTVTELPPASVSKGKHGFVGNEKAFRRSEIVSGQSRYSWQQAGGDTRKLVAGATSAEEVEEVSIEASVPNMRKVDNVSGLTEKYVCEIPISGNSSLMDDNYDGKFSLVLTQIRGHRSIDLHEGATVESAFIEDANPTTLDESGNESHPSCLNLSIVGKDSIGELWLKPLYDFKGNKDVYRMTAKLPAWAFLRVMTLLQPQRGAASVQERWLQVQGGRYLPIKISYEFGSSSLITTTIECARMHRD